MKKALRPEDALWFEEIPNVGKRVAGDFRRLGLSGPRQLKNKDPFKLYQKLCCLTQTRHDPCLLDTFMAAVAFMNGKGARPWWKFTAERKRNMVDNKRRLKTGGIS